MIGISHSLFPGTRRAIRVKLKQPFHRAGPGREDGSTHPYRPGKAVSNPYEPAQTWDASSKSSTWRAGRDTSSSGRSLLSKSAASGRIATTYKRKVGDIILGTHQVHQQSIYLNRCAVARHAG